MISKSFFEKHKTLIALFIIYSLCLGIRIYWLSQKDGFHVDESLSVFLSCYNTYDYDFERPYTGKEAKEFILCDNDSIKNVFGDILRLWKDNRDSPHTNLYYSFLRLSLVGLKTGDINLIIFRGGILNLMFFTASFIFFFLLMKRLFPGFAALQLAAVFCAFLSTATISNTIFLRPYQIQETMFIVFCYFFFKTIEAKKYITYDNKLYVDVKLILALSLITAFTLLTGYYAIFFIGLFSLYVIYTNYKTKNLTEILFYVAVLGLGIVFAQILYLRYLKGFFSGRATETVNTLFGNTVGNIMSSATSIGILLQKHFFTYPVIFICILCLMFLIFSRQKIVIQKQALYIFVAAMLYCGIMFIAPYKTLRYIMAVFPFFIMLPAVIIYSLGKRKVSVIAMILLCFFFIKNAVYDNNVENTFKNKPDRYLFSKNPTVPVFVFNRSGIDWRHTDLIPYFNDDQVYYFYNNFENLHAKLMYWNEFYLIVERGFNIPDNSFDQFEVEEDFSFGYFIFKKLLLKEKNTD